MSRYTIKKCPHCGTVYEKYSTYTKQYKNHTGSPFLVCNHCGVSFVDKDIREPALVPQKHSEITVFNCIFGMFIPYGAMGLLSTVAATNIEPRSIGLWIFAVSLDLFYFLSVIFFLHKRKKFNEIAEKEYEESYKRLKNPEYARALKDAGYDVPSWFLKT